jgi:hypothetical protein
MAPERKARQEFLIAKGNLAMDIASPAWLKHAMRSGFPALLLVVASLISAFAQVPGPPVIVTHPASVNAYVGETVTLSVAVEGTGPMAYQWHLNGVDIVGAISSSLTVTAAIVAPATVGSAVYGVVVKNAIGSAFSFPVVVLVYKHPQTIAFALPAAAATTGSAIRLSATASSNLPVMFSLVSGSGSLSGNVLNGVGGEVVVRASQPGDANYAPADPVDRTIAFYAGVLAPFITTAPTDQSALAGTSLTLRVQAIGTPPPSYQWRKDGTPIDGATSATLAFSSLTLADAARYTVSATNLAGTATTSAAQIIVRSAPVLTTVPASMTVAAGAAASMSVEVAAFPAPTYQWRKNGTAISGATRSTFTLASATRINAGNYDVVVINALGSTTSPAATLTVITRDFSGTYVGRFTGSAGDCLLQVRADGTAAFFGHFPALVAGVVGLAVNLDLSGNLSATLPLIAATTREVTLRGTIDEVAGSVAGTLAELNVRFDGTRAGRSSTLAVQAGIYSAALVGSASGRGYVIIAPDGQAFLLTATGTTVDSARGTISATGRLTTTTTTQAAIDLGFTNGALRGTVRTSGPTATTGTIAGAIEGIAGTEHLVNLSVRAVTAPAAPMITGFAISGTVAKQVLIRAAGPTLGRAPFNVSGALADPTLQLFRVNTQIGQNNDWGSPANTVAALTAATIRVGAFPFATGSADAALLTTLQPGVYTVQIGGGTGVVLAEIYEVTEANEAPGARRLVNTSTLGIIIPDFPLIAGFVISGTAPQRVLIRGSGPALAGAPFNIPGTLANPQVTIYRGSTVVRTNDDWFRDPEAAVIRDAALRVRAFAFGAQSLDAAILTYLEPGAYTAVVSGPTNAATDVATGLALVEIYEATP